MLVGETAFYPLGLTALFAVLLLLSGRYSQRLLLSYGLTLGLSLFIATNVPKLSTRFLFTSPALAALFVFSLLCIDKNKDGRVDETVDNPKGQNSTIYKLMTYAKETKLGKTPTIQFALNAEKKPYFEYMQKETPSGPYGGTYVLVAVYKINY